MAVLLPHHPPPLFSSEAETATTYRGLRAAFETLLDNPRTRPNYIIRPLSFVAKVRLPRSIGGTNTGT